MLEKNAAERRSSDCSKPIYASVFAWREWLRDEALAAAHEGRYVPPAWAASNLAAEALTSAESAAEGEGDDLSGGCAAAGTGPGRGGFALAALGLAAALDGRRRRAAR